MGIEIERKYLVKGSQWKTDRPANLVQGYLCTTEGSTVRVRIADLKAFLTIKGKTTGISRAEFEYEIPLSDTKELLQLSNGSLVKKQRHSVQHQGFLWTIDEFSGENEGLIVAEIELDSDQQRFAKPEWITSEVSTDPRYRNSYLTKHPFSQW